MRQLSRRRSEALRSSASGFRTIVQPKDRIGSMLRLAHEFGVALVASLCPLPGRLDRFPEGVVACDETMDASVLVHVQEPRDVEQIANTGPRSRFQQQVVAFGDHDGGAAV